jgi:hypothetical protein
LVRDAIALQSGEEISPLDPDVVHTFAGRLRDVIRSGRPGDQNV